MDNRPTNEITTPSGKKAVLKTYLTARERNEIRSVLLERVNLDPETGQTKVGAIDAALLEKSERKIIEAVIVAFDGSTEKITDRILDGTPQDYDFIVEAANKVGNFGLAK